MPPVGGGWHSGKGKAMSKAGHTIRAIHKRLYYHKTDLGAEYLTDKWILRPDGGKEGAFRNARIIVRIDGDIRKDAEVTLTEGFIAGQGQTDANAAAPDLAAACKIALEVLRRHDAGLTGCPVDAGTALDTYCGEDGLTDTDGVDGLGDVLRAALAKAEGRK